MLPPPSRGAVGRPILHPHRQPRTALRPEVRPCQLHLNRRGSYRTVLTQCCDQAVGLRVARRRHPVGRARHPRCERRRVWKTRGHREQPRADPEQADRTRQRRRRREGIQHLVGATDQGKSCALAPNELNDSELAGPAFSPTAACCSPASNRRATSSRSLVLGAAQQRPQLM